MEGIFFKKYGEGPPVLLLHGFPMSSVIWEEPFISRLSADFQVYAIDLPGFGKSPPPKEIPITITGVAKQLIDWLKGIGINKVVPVGHSLGGYIALAMVEAAPELFPGFVLFHSTAYADTAERRQSREKVIEFVEKNGAPAFTTNFIPPLFTNKEHNAINPIRTAAAQITAQVVVGYTKAMRDRPERTSAIQTFNKPILFLAGDQDQGITIDSVRQQASLSEHAVVNILKGQTHMAMIEAPHETSSAIATFAHDCYA